MALVSTLREQAKNFLNIATATTTWDTDIDNYIGYAVKKLYPRVLKEIDADTSKTFTALTRNVALPTGTTDVRTLELYDADVADYRPTKDYSVHAGYIWLDNAVSVATVARIFGLGKYSITGTTPSTDIPTELEIVIIYWAVAMFYNAVAGNKRKYNAYLGSAGAANNKDMKDSADHFNELAEWELQNATNYGG